MKATVFQLNILPFLLGLGLTITGQFFLIPIAILALIISLYHPTSTVAFFTHIFSMIAGGYYGNYVLTNLLSASVLWHLVGVLAGFVIMFILKSIIVGFVSK
ncbi:MAG: hypothetical protein KGY75_06180 [Candidatus Cloacimonetes bacterium]|nr:hypothetical protein [Candidatus Cloacimonadota bacterium]MBS3767687.1 hypothetical protein [Candidatus Cloacimonadota bacterium]